MDSRGAALQPDERDADDGPDELICELDEKADDVELGKQRVGVYPLSLYHHMLVAVESPWQILRKGLHRNHLSGTFQPLSYMTSSSASNTSSLRCGLS